MGPPQFICYYCGATGYGAPADLVQSGWRRQILDKNPLAVGKRVAVCSECWGRPEVKAQGHEDRAS